MRESKDVLLFLLLIFIQQTIAVAQEDTSSKKWVFSGYVRSLQGIYRINDPLLEDPLYFNDNFLHVRTNLAYYATNNITIKAELRNRFFFGELSKSELFPDFKQNLKEANNDVLNLQLINTGDALIVHSVFDRLYGEYVKNNLEVRVGRQRINWGVHTIWNPNDIFNAFSFTDFDYPERPGADAIRIKYYTGSVSSIEFAAKAFKNSDEITAGLLWKTNQWNYDFQLMGGLVNEDIVMGAGWSGAIKNVGFNGEASFFKPLENNDKDVFTITTGFDYSFDNGIILGGGGLYNSNSNDSDNLFAFELSAKNLYPYEWTIYSNIVKSFTPLFSGSLLMLYSPVTGNPLFLNPTLSYSLMDNLDINLIGQILFNDSDQLGYYSPTQVGYLRISWNF